MKERSAGLFLLTRQNDYQRLQETAAVAMARHLKIPLEVRFADNEAPIQTQQISAFIHAQPAGSVVAVEAVSDGALEPLARHAALARMGWLLLNRTTDYLDHLRRDFPTAPFGSVTADQKEIGRLQGKQFEALLRGKGTVLYLRGPADASAARDRLAGMKEIVDGTSIKYHVVHADWTEGGGEHAVSTWLRDAGTPPDLNLVGCQNDAMAAGALRALASSGILNRPGFSNVLVTGVDGNPDYGVPLVDRNRLAATVVVPPVTGHALELIHSVWNAPGFSLPAVVRLQVRSYPELGSITLRAAR